VIFAADHGLALGSHGLLGKQNLYEHSQKCPLILAGPGIPAGQATHALTYLMDLFPTVLRLAGIAPAPDIDGADLAPLWRGEKDKVRDSLFLSYRNLMRAVRDERYKLLRYPQINYTQLFDLANDPDELHNLAEASEQAGRVEHLMRLLGEWQRRVGDTQPLATDKPQPHSIDMSGAERQPDKWQPEWIVKKYFAGARP
jgi:arylsulfatase A-like enzyme